MDILGIDIAKATFDVCLLGGAQVQRHQFANTPAGFKQLATWLKEQGVEQVHACMEATNIYYEGLAYALVEQGQKVSVVNPLQIKAFRESRLRRTKNDRQDAWLIALFCQQQAPAAWRPLTPEQRTLQALVRHLDSLEQDLRQQSNRLESCRDEAVAASLCRIIALIKDEMKAVETKIQDHIDQHPDLKNQHDLLQSIPGYGAKTAAKLLGNLPHLAEYASAKEAAADVGLTPLEHQSGESIRGKPRLSKIGKARLRKSLYFPAIVALRYNPIIQALKERLEARGKAKMVIIGAAMRKLIHIAYGVLKNNRPFDPNYAH